MRQSRRAFVGQLRGDVDDATLATRFHVTIDGLRHEKSAFDVHVQHAVKTLFTDLFEVLGDVVAGVVDQNVDVTQRVFRGRAEALNGGDVGDITFGCNTLAPHRFDLLLSFRGILIVAKVAKSDVRTLMRQRQCNPLPNSARATRYKCRFTDQFLRHKFSSHSRRLAAAHSISLLDMSTRHFVQPPKHLGISRGAVAVFKI